ncbi:MAG: hypothetical protein U9N04_05005 [Patescibacteria group bacterium]|nr:hypothetical protein [Patescibacteria group bacterium]
MKQIKEIKEIVDCLAGNPLAALFVVVVVAPLLLLILILIVLVLMSI